MAKLATVGGYGRQMNCASNSKIIENGSPALQANSEGGRQTLATGVLP